MTGPRTDTGPTAMHTALQAPPPKWAPIFALLVDRACQFLHAHRMPAQPVPFTWWAAGEERRYLAAWDWTHGEPGPRVWVLTARDSERVCASLPGDLWTIDPATVQNNAAPDDEIARCLAEQGQRPDKRRGR